MENWASGPSCMLLTMGNETQPKKTEGSPGWLSNRPGISQSGHWFSVESEPAALYWRTASVQRTFTW
jgi:hypothetical protein